LGALAPGQLADIVMMDRNSFPFVPLNDPIKQLVYCENGISVSDVMIDGRWVLRKRKLVTMDEAAVYAKANDLRAEMDERVQEQFRHTRELEPALHAAYLKTAKTTWSERDGS
jgi:cytosine/adenosine deaminase-related metal-dependent hydrolase